MYRGARARALALFTRIEQKTKTICEALFNKVRHPADGSEAKEVEVEVEGEEGDEEEGEEMDVGGSELSEEEQGSDTEGEGHGEKKGGEESEESEVEEPKTQVRRRQTRGKISRVQKRSVATKKVQSRPMSKKAKPTPNLSILPHCGINFFNCSWEAFFSQEMESLRGNVALMLLDPPFNILHGVNSARDRFDNVRIYASIYTVHI